ncbi:hypothetical protein ACVOMV_06955 [Mesorhizobium atlanticum]
MTDQAARAGLLIIDKDYQPIQPDHVVNAAHGLRRKDGIVPGNSYVPRSSEHRQRCNGQYKRWPIDDARWHVLARNRLDRLAVEIPDAVWGILRCGEGLPQLGRTHLEVAPVRAPEEAAALVVCHPVGCYQAGADTHHEHDPAVGAH